MAARVPALICLVAALLGLAFGTISTLDYAAHLDRQVHDLHCSIVPGAPVAKEGDTGCRVAMYSAYSAVMRERIWGGVPIGLFAMGAFCFFAAFAAYLALAGPRAPRHAVGFMALAGVTPLVVSIGMGTLSAVTLGAFCMTCVGIYSASLLLAVGGVAGWVKRHRAAIPELPTTGQLRFMHALSWLSALAAFALSPALVYARAVPSYAEQVKGCGTLATHDDPEAALLHFTPAGALQPVLMLVDPLCPTCKAFHQRLVAEGLLARMDVTLGLFPLDSECNWNLTAPLHPGACIVSRAVVCSERPLAVLEWAYDEQETLATAAKAQDGDAKLLGIIDERFPGLAACSKEKKTRTQLDAMMRFAVKNKLEVATPQLFVGSDRLCDQDSDIGLSYALTRLAPALGRP